MSSENYSSSPSFRRIARIRNRKHEVPNDFLNEMHKWSLECKCNEIDKISRIFHNSRINIESFEEFVYKKVSLSLKDLKRKFCEDGIFELYKRILIIKIKCNSLKMYLYKFTLSAFFKNYSFACL